MYEIHTAKEANPKIKSFFKISATMAEEKYSTTYDVIILGASGFTGKYVIREALKFLNSPNSPLKSLALAGRSPSRLSEALKWAVSGVGDAVNSSPEIPILTADTSDPSSLRRLAAKGKIILNCVGPFRLYGIFIALLCKTALGRWLLLKFPSFFSLGWFRKEGPTEEEVESASFRMWFVGQGYSDPSLASRGDKKPDTEVITRVSGPEIGYRTTPIILVQCALVVLAERDNLPKGGVLTPGIVFGPTNLEERLQENGISFDFISKKALHT